MWTDLFLWFILIAGGLLIIWLIWTVVRGFFQPADYWQLIPRDQKPSQQGIPVAEQVAGLKKQGNRRASGAGFFPVRPGPQATQARVRPLKMDNQHPRFAGRVPGYRPNAPCWVCGRPKVQCTGHELRRSP